jgi:hypothetical protein
MRFKVTQLAIAALFLILTVFPAIRLRVEPVPAA